MSGELGRGGLSRRGLFQSGACAAAGLFFTIGCRRSVPDSCKDTTAFSPEDAEARRTLAYVDATPWPEKTCEACQQYVAGAAAGACGSCKVLKGAVHPHGYCKLFAKR